MALKIIGGIVLAFILLGCIPVGATAEYSAEGYWVAIKAGPISIRILPKKPKPEPVPEDELDDKARKKKEKQKKKEKKKKEKQKQKEREKKEAEKKEAEAAQSGKPQEKKGGNLPMFKELIGLALEAQSSLRKKLKLKEMTLHLTIGGGGWDPAKSAILYGRAWAGLGNLWTVLERVFIIKKHDVWADIDFLTPENTIYARATATITIGAVVKLGVRYGLRALRIYLRHRRRKKKANQGSVKKGGK